MIIISEVNIDEFKLKIYPEYVKMFDEDERKSLQFIESLVNKKIMKIIKITYNDLFIGFMIINQVKDNNYIQLDYLAILPPYQNKGYGTKSINLLKKIYNQYSGIFVEVEKLDSKLSKKDNEIRQRRIKFYEKLNFKQLPYEFKWFNSLILIPYLLLISEKDSDEIILNNILSLYAKTHGIKKLKESLKVIKKTIRR